jgi:phosphate starvation-inducible PhoH-like protein
MENILKIYCLVILYMSNQSNGNGAGDKRKGRKGRRQNEKEILDEHSEELGNLKSQKNVYENMHYLSEKEQGKFNDTFTKPKNRSQEIYTSMLRSSAKKIVIATGPAGTGKTLFATEYGIRNFLQGHCERLVFTRPSVSVDEDLGYLPGTLEEKMAPWIRPIYDILYQFISPKEVTELLDDKIIEIAPLGYMRGRTFKNAWIVADEMQNATKSQMKMLLTRIGDNSKLVITGDLEQPDRDTEINGLEDFLDKFRGSRSSSISSFEFERDDIQREEVVKEVLEIYSHETMPENYLGSSPDSVTDNFMNTMLGYGEPNDDEKSR